MFGYIRMDKSLLDEEAFGLFRAYYCGLCKRIGKRSQLARMGLSYDMTFLLILLTAIDSDEPETAQRRCMLHPFKREKTVEKSNALDYVADMSILLGLKKSEDDFKDEKSPKAFIGKFFYSRAYRGLRKKYHAQEKETEQQLNKLSQLEAENSQNSDETAHCFAKICELLFTPDFITDENTKKAMGWLGYNLGRWIYIIDAVDDVEKDVKNKAYNPFSQKYLKMGEAFKKEAELTLTYTLANIAAAYDLLNIRRNGKVLENIIYSGLEGVQSGILNKQEEKDESLRGSRCKAGGR